MEKTYILLRSNKQQGPYTLAQLTKMDLQPDDLIHVQHGVAGWQYAEEIEVLKPYFSAHAIPSIPVVDADNPPPVSPAIVPAVKTEVVKKTAGVFASLPEGIQPSPSVSVFAVFPEGSQPSPSGLKLQSASSTIVHATRPRTRQAVEVTKESVPLAGLVEPQKPAIQQQPVIQQPVLQPQKSVPHEKETILTSVRRESPKTLPVSKRRPVTIGLSLLALGALAFGINQFATSGGKNDTTQSGREKADLGASTSNSNTEVPHNKLALQHELPLTDTEEERKASTPAQEEQPDSKILPAVNQPEERSGASIPDSGQDAAEVVALPKANELSKEPEAPAPRATPDLTEQIYLKSNFTTNELGEGVYDLAVSLDNKSDKLLKTVAVNVVFTDNDGKTLNKQTIYFSNVKPGEAMVRSASQHKLAKRVRCELGLVSSEGLLFYAN